MSIRAMPTADAHGEIMMAAPLSAATASVSPLRRAAARRLLSLAGNVLVALFYAIFLYSAVQFWIRTGSPVGFGLIVFNTLLVACLLTRRAPVGVTGSIRNWIVAPLTTVMPLLLRPTGTASAGAAVLSTVAQALGLAIMIASLTALNRSIGVVAANRGVKTGGPYAWVRHPLYAGEILFFIGFLASNPSYRNGFLVALLVLAQVVRIYHEEAVLLHDERYVAYQAAVPARLIPRLF